MDAAHDDRTARSRFRFGGRSFALALIVAIGGGASAGAPADALARSPSSDSTSGTTVLPPAAETAAEPGLAEIIAAGSGTDAILDVTGYFAAGAGAGYVPRDPVRLVDTRTGTGLTGPFAADTPRTFQVAGRGGVPADAVAVTLNVTVTTQTAGGYVSITPTPNADPSTSSLNFPRGDTRANGLTVPLGPGGTLSAVYKAGAGAQAHILVDVTGFFAASGGATDGGTHYVARDPLRFLDTRTGNGLSGRFVANVARTFQVTGRGGIPAGAVAVTVNITVTEQSAAGYVSLTRTPTAAPSTSSLNFPLGDNRANGLTVPLGPGGTLAAVYKAAGGSTTHLVLDVTGYFIAGSGGAGYVPTAPARVLDTRVGTGLAGMFASSLPRTFQVGGAGGVPADAVAVTVNLTVTAQTAGGYVSLTTTATGTPKTSSLNFPLGDNRANGLTVPLAPDGTLAAVFKGPKSRDFPAGATGYHNEWEVIATIRAAEVAHPDLVDVVTIGQSYQGRHIYAAKVSDNVTVDEAEPEVLFDGGTHGDEHMGVEMTLQIFRWLVDGYAADPRITTIVDTREIWLVFIVNPDGAEYDISGGRYHFWRKNRQPTPGSTAIGTDLNRNFGYRWGGGGNTSSNPRAITYRGPTAFSAPETRAMRGFLAGRVVGGVQQIRAAITFHEYGRLVMWPYGYTLSDVPSDMTVQDHSALAALGRRMAATNGYRPQQASDLYITSGTTRDYEYGVYRIFSYTFELSTKDYPDDSTIASETGRNREAVLGLLEMAWCPLSILGADVRLARCGAFDDDLEVARGWVSDPDGTDTAPANAAFARTNPADTASSGPKQLGTAPSGSIAFVTGGPAGSSAEANDLDGRTTLRSRAFRLPADVGQRLTFAYTFAHDTRSSAEDVFRAIVERDDGSRVTVFEERGSGADRDGTWKTASVSMDPFAGTTIRIRFEAIDGGPDNLVEVAIDDVRVTRAS